MTPKGIPANCARQRRLTSLCGSARAQLRTLALYWFFHFTNWEPRSGAVLRGENYTKPCQTMHKCPHTLSYKKYKTLRPVSRPRNTNKGKSKTTISMKMGHSKARARCAQEELQGRPLSPLCIFLHFSPSRLAEA